ncbi:MAG: HD domain-containing protein [bacterium]|nr:HD domain-containing protein [bacterium]
MSSPWTVRVRQVVEFLTRHPDPEDERWALDALPEELRPLYRRMRPYDRYHCTGVARRFAALQPPAWALQGALLHDCGKPPGFGLLARILGVLFPDPGVQADPPARHPVRRIQQVYRWHGEYGARLARAAGLCDEGCELIANHHARGSRVDGSWLARFQAVDDD